MKKLAALVLAGIVFATGCSSGGSAQKSIADQIKEKGKLTMYTNAEFPPYEFVKSNEIVGVDVEIGKEIAKKLGVELEIVNAEFNGIIASIASGKGDVAISGITITDERKESVDFSAPYVDSVQYIILPEDSSIKVMEDLEGKKVGAQTGTTGEMLVQDEIDKGVLKDKGAEVKQYTSAPIAMADLIAGRLDAVVIDEYVAKEIANANPGYQAIKFVKESGDPVTEQYGVAIAKGHEDFLKIIDEVVNGMLADGSIDKYMEQYAE